MQREPQKYKGYVDDAYAADSNGASYAVMIYDVRHYLWLDKLSWCRRRKICSDWCPSKNTSNLRRVSANCGLFFYKNRNLTIESFAKEAAAEITRRSSSTKLNGK